MEQIRKKGCVVVRNVVDDAEVLSWKADLQQHVQANPLVPGKCSMCTEKYVLTGSPGFPVENKQFFML